MAKKLLSPEEVRDFLVRRFNNQHQNWLAGEGSWPLEVALGVPTERDVSEDAAAIREWVQAWQHRASPGRLDWVERHFGRLGTHRFPACMAIENARDVAIVVGQEQRWTQASERYTAVTTRWPALGGTGKLASKFGVLADYSQVDFDRLVGLLEWIESHPKSGMALRQVPIPGLDTKWLETRIGLVGALVRLLLETEETDFYALTGLKRPQHRVRIRVLCPTLRHQLGGLCDIEAPVSELAGLSIRPTAVIAVENQETGLALPDLEGTVAVMKLGNAVGALSALPWIREAVAIYWGDIDTYGFAILHRARATVPQLRSVLMDPQTLLAHRDLWGQEPIPCPDIALDLLTLEERDMYDGLRANRWSWRIRLEQERISWEHAMPALRRALGMV